MTQSKTPALADTAGALADGWFEARELPRCRAKDPREDQIVSLVLVPLAVLP